LKNIIEGYIGIWIVMLLLYLCLAFTTINMNVVQAKNILNDVKAQVSASNGSIVDSSTNEYSYKSSDNSITLKNNGYSFEYKITRQSLYKDASGNDVYDDATRDNTFQYNNLYKIELKYRYVVPIFGTQVYPITTLVY
jgi:hypothetical protein